jgi:uncharacterized protein (TIGR03663 family)
LANPPPKIRWAIFSAVALLALVIRLPQLGERPMHTDESVNAYIIGQLLAGERFHYDPHDRHGPALAALALPLVKWQGAKSFSDLTESQLRLAPVFAGTATVCLFGAGVEMFGFIACLVASILFAFTPLPVYYNRCFIHETLFVGATLGLILSGWRVLENKSFLSAALAGLCAALMLACKETAVLHFTTIALALLACRFLNKGENTTQTTGQPSLKIIFTVIAVFIFTLILLFNGSDAIGLFSAIPHLAARARGEGHDKPFWYYLILLGGGWSGMVILGLVTLGIFRGLHSPGRIFLAAYALLTIFIYSVIPYKTPWLALNFWLPLVILAGAALEWIWFAAQKFYGRVLILISAGVLVILIAHDTHQKVFVNPADEKNPYAYAHTSEDLLRLPTRLAELTRQEKLTNPRIAVVAADAWPLPWYLRKFSQVGFWQPNQNTGEADFFITTADVSEKLAERLKNFRPEYFGWRPDVLLILWTPLTMENKL